MLADELKKITKDKYKYWDKGIILFCPANAIFYKISFGDGSDDEPIDDCDNYMYLTMDRFNEHGEYEEDIDGGNMWFHEKDYTGYINDEKLIRNCLEFLECPNPDECIFVSQFS